MQIDHAGKDVSRLIQLDADCAVSLRSGWRALTLPDSNNPIASYQHSAVFDDRMPIVHSNDAAAKDQPTGGIKYGQGVGVNTSGFARCQQWKGNEDSQNESMDWNEHYIPQVKMSARSGGACNPAYCRC